MSHATTRQKTLEYRIYFTIGFLVAMPIVLFDRLFPRQLEPFERPETRRGLVTEARAMTNTVIPFVFMS